MNLNALELAWVRGTTHIGPEVCARIRAAAEANDVALSVHATYFFNLNSDTEEMWLAGRERSRSAHPDIAQTMLEQHRGEGGRRHCGEGADHGGG